MAKKKSLPEPSIAKDSNDEWETKSHARTIIEAHEIMNDKAKMKKVKGHLKSQKDAIRSIDDIVKYRNKKFGPKSAASSDEHDESED